MSKFKVNEQIKIKWNKDIHFIQKDKEIYRNNTLFVLGHSLHSSPYQPRLSLVGGAIITTTSHFTCPCICNPRNPTLAEKKILTKKNFKQETKRWTYPFVAGALVSSPLTISASREYSQSEVYKLDLERRQWVVGEVHTPSVPGCRSKRWCSLLEWTFASFFSSSAKSCLAWAFWSLLAFNKNSNMK